MEKKVNYRWLEPDEFNKYEELSSFCFQFERTPFEEKKDIATYATNRKIGAFDESGNLMSKVAIHPMSIWIGGKLIKMGGISNVATWPEHRNKGYVNHLMSMAINTLKNDSVSLSFLLPFSTPFYKKYGYETVVFHKKINICFDNIKNMNTIHGSIEKVDCKDMRLRQVYDKYVKNKCLMLDRNNFWWEYRVFQEKNSTYIFLNSAGEAEGYISLSAKDHHLEIHEIISLNNKTYISIFSFINKFNSMAKTIEFKKLPIDDPLHLFAEEPKFDQIITPYYAAKIVLFKDFILQYPFLPAFCSTEFIIRIVDNYSEWNNGVYKITINEQGDASIIDANSDTPDISMAIQDFTKFVLGGFDLCFFDSIGLSDKMYHFFSRIRKETRFFPEFF